MLVGWLAQLDSRSIDFKAVSYPKFEQRVSVRSRSTLRALFPEILVTHFGGLGCSALSHAGGARRPIQMHQLSVNLPSSDMGAPDR